MADRALAAERIIRSVARRENRLIAGALARVTARDPGVRAELEAALRAMGARIGTADSAPAAPGALPELIFGETSDASGPSDPPAPLDAWARIERARRAMPATAALAARLRASLAGRREGAPLRVAVSLVVEPKTAALVLALADAGFEVALFGAVAETDPEVAAALAADGRIAVFAPAAVAAGRASDAAAGGGETPAALDARHAAAVLEWRPEYLIDDGSHLIRLAHTERPGALRELRGAAEETTSGVRPLRAMESEGALGIPVIAVNDARTKTGFDNLIGTGQSCVFAIADLLDALDAAGGPGYRGLSGSRWAVFGYGPVGVGTARFAAALGARITVVEPDPVRALAALHDGFEARTAEEALPEADVVVSASGVRHTVEAGHFALMRPGAAVAVAGGVDDELALDGLAAASWTRADLGGQVAEWSAPGASRGVLVLANGDGVNYTAAEGNPIEVMDLSFATQLAALARLMRGDLAPGLHLLSAAEECLVAEAALASRGGSAAIRTPAIRASALRTPEIRTPAAPGSWRDHRYLGPGRSPST